MAFLSNHGYFDRIKHMLSLRKFFTRKIIISAFVAALAFFIFGLYWVNKLKIAHSSFENYYNFRGCVELLEKTDTYGTCKLSSGETIKLVKVENKWFLDGDLGW
jgi:flagellar biogenesis protein FliO